MYLSLNEILGPTSNPLFIIIFLRFVSIFAFLSSIQEGPFVHQVSLSGRYDTSTHVNKLSYDLIKLHGFSFGPDEL